MSRFRRQRQIIKHIIMLVAIPLAVTGTGYAAFTQTLNTSGTGTLPGYTATQSMSMTYTMTNTLSAGVYTYNISATVKYNGVDTITAWQVKFDLPSGFTNLSCTNATCTSSSQTVTAVNTGTNGTINPNGTVVFTGSFKSTTANYVLQKINVSGTEAPVWQTMSGLTVSGVQGTQTKAGNTYTDPYTITVTNNSGQAIKYWRILGTWLSANVVTVMPGTVTYTTTTSQITMLSTTGVANGATFQFLPTFTTTTKTWALSPTIQGSL